jgi:hypothetical protein
MLIRIFDTVDRGLVKYINLVRMEHGSKTSWDIEIAHPVQWIPGETSTADIHIYMETPNRLACPFAAYNVLVTDFPSFAWTPWTKGEIDLTVGLAALTERATAVTTFRRLFKSAAANKHPHRIPAALARQPKVAVITLTRNRVGWWGNMVKSVTEQEWPVERLEWIILDNGDEGTRLESQVAELRARLPALTVKYVVAPTSWSLGAKRNAAVAEASADVEAFVIMDDDDYYPVGSIKTRLTWLNAGEGRGCTYSATLPMYDTTRYISAMNVAPLDHGIGRRVSEATLAFTRSFWTAKHFPDVSVGEGEEFVEGRESQTVEIPPTGTIVSFLHKGNTSSRRIPPEQEPNGCHFGFTDEFFRYIHSIA